MKNDLKQIEVIKKDIAEMAQAKRDRINHLKRGGSLKNLAPKYKRPSRPF